MRKHETPFLAALLVLIVGLMAVKNMIPTGEVVQVFNEPVGCVNADSYCKDFKTTVYGCDGKLVESSCQENTHCQSVGTDENPWKTECVPD